MPEYVCQREIGAERDVPEESKAGTRGRVLVLPHDRLDVLVVRGNATSHESVRSGQSIE